MPALTVGLWVKKATQDTNAQCGTAPALSLADSATPRQVQRRTSGPPAAGTRQAARRLCYMDILDDPTYPEAPWHLTGTACVSAWRVPTTDLPPPPKGLAYATLGDNALVLTIWAAYLPGGTLAYNELTVAVVVRRHGMLAPAGTVTHIWVDDERSAEGGRRLWSVPKQLGNFVIEPRANDSGFAGRLTAGGQPVASVSFEPSMSLPGQPSASGFVIQQNDCGLLRTRCRGRGRLVTGRANWDFAATGPLGLLHGRTPLLSLRLRDLQASFGI